MMRPYIKVFLLLLTPFILLFSGIVYAYPTLQLDIAGGTYDSTTQTIIAPPSNPITLYAYLIPNSNNLLTDWYYISAGVVPNVGPSDVDLGSFIFNGKTIRVTEDMVYGVPPLETVLALQGQDSGDLGLHGIYPTYFSEFGFQFQSSNQISPYDTRVRANGGGSIPASGSGMYYAAFVIDTSNVNVDFDYVIHFDLYNTKLITKTGDIDIQCDKCYAPFSHDAQSAPVPEPSTMLLLGSGLLGLAPMFRAIIKKK